MGQAPFFGFEPSQAETKILTYAPSQNETEILFYALSQDETLLPTSALSGGGENMRCLSLRPSEMEKSCFARRKCYLYAT